MRPSRASHYCEKQLNFPQQICDQTVIAHAYIGVFSWSLGSLKDKSKVMRAQKGLLPRSHVTRTGDDKRANPKRPLD